MNIDEMPAGRELDALIAEKVMGWVVNFDNTYVTDATEMTEMWMPIPKFSISETVALRVASCIRAKGGWHLRMVIERRQIYAHFWKGMTWKRKWKRRRSVFACADSAPLAICRAALKVVMKC